MLNDSQMSKLAEMCEMEVRCVDGLTAHHLKDGDLAAIYLAHVNRWELLAAGYFVVIEKLGLEPRQDDEESEHWRMYRRRRYGGTEYPYADTLPAAIDAALQEIL